MDALRRLNWTKLAERFAIGFVAVFIGTLLVLAIGVTLAMLANSWPLALLIFPALILMWISGGWIQSERDRQVHAWNREHMPPKDDDNAT